MNRRQLLHLSAAIPTYTFFHRSKAPKTDYTALDMVLAEPVLKKELFPDPVMIDTLELLHFKGNFICRVRSKDGAMGLSIANNMQMIHSVSHFCQSFARLLSG